MKLSSLRQTAIVFCILSMLIMPGIGFCEEVTKETKPVNAATVNGKPIPYSDYQWGLDIYEMRMQAGGKPGPGGIDAQTRKDILDNMIGHELIYQKAVEKGINVTDEWIKNELSAFKMRFPSEEQYQTLLTRMNITEDRLKERLAKDQVVREFIEKEIVPKIKVEEKDTEAFYKENKQRFAKPEEVHARHILIKVEKDASDEQKAEARKKLTDLKKQIDGGADFSELAKANSQCPSATQGGDLGFFSKGKMVPEFEKAAFALKPNEVSGIVETQYGYHLIKALEHNAPKEMAFDEVKQNIEKHLRNEKIQSSAEAYANDLRKSAKIETFTN